MKLRYKLLIAFFITTSLTGVSTTIFAIYYFSSVIHQEAMDSMKKYLEVSQLVYDNQLEELKNFSRTIANNRGFELFARIRVTEKLEQLLHQYSKDLPHYHIQVFDKSLVRIAEAGLGGLPNLQEHLSYLPPTTLLEKAGDLNNKDSIASIESIAFGQNSFLTLSAATPIIDGSERVGTLLVRYVLKDIPPFTQTLEKMLGIRVILNVYNEHPNARLLPHFFQSDSIIGWQNKQFTNNLKLGEFLSYNLPLYDLNNTVIATLGIHVQTDRYVTAIQQAIVNLISLMALCITVAFVLAYLMAYSVLKPLRQLLRGVEGIGSHDFLNSAQQLSNRSWHGALPIDRSDELGTLAEAFALMAQHLQQSFAAVEERNHELQQLNQLKDEFLANTSHELKTPIQGIIGLAETLLDNKELSESQQKNLLTIIHSGYRLSNLVNDILDFSRLRYRDIELNCQAVNFRSLADIVIILSKPLLEDKPVSLNNAISNNLPLVYGDENRLQQILHNLIGNAIKFTEKGDITVSATIRSKSHDVVIKVRDTGVGIATDSLQRIFEAFEQADGSTSRTYGGTGLGLAITRRLVELHGGQIWADSTPDKGSTFYFSLPLARNQDVQAEISSSKINSILSTHILLSNPPILETKEKENISKETSEPVHYAAHILVVDDEALNRRILMNHLHSHHYRVTEANSGRVALELLENGLLPDLVLLDVMMPNMTGYQVTEILRQRWQADELPIVLLTAKSQISDIILGLETGANDYLTKPISKEELLARLKTHLNLRELRYEKQRLELRQAQFLEAMPIGVKILEANGKPYYNNSQAARLGLDFSLSEDNKEPINHFYRSGTNAFYPSDQLPLLKALQGKSAYADDLEIHDNNHCIALECWSAPVFENNEIRYVIATFQEITARKKAELELRANETRFRQLMEAMSAAVVIVQVNGTILYANRATEELTGYPISALQQLKLWKLIHPDYRDKIITPKRIRLNDKFLPVRYELPIVNYQNHVRWLDITARKIDYQGKSALIINGLDITERKTTTELLNNIAAGLMSYTGKNFLLSLVEYLVHTLQVDCVFIAQYFPTQYGEQMIVDFISTGNNNHHLEKFTYQLKGTASFEVIQHRRLYTCQQNAWQFFPQDLLLQSLAAECFIGTPLLSANGSLLGLMAIVNCQSLENYTLHESALRIFAARAAAELERQAALETLEAERASLAEHVQERTSELSRANAELARAARLKDEFLANMSHELRTPLNAILGLSEALLEGAFGSLTEPQHRSLTVLLESGRHLLELINDILDLAKIEANKIQLCLSEVYIKDVCESSLRLIQEMANKKRMSLHSAFDSEIGLVSVDARRLKQILVNLLSNAVKFTPEGGKVYLTTCGLKETQQISISIRDTGIGMRQADLPRLFRPFEQLDGGLDRAHEGTGLGLALVQRLVTMHNGTIEVESQLNQGSCFTIYLPWIIPEPEIDLPSDKKISPTKIRTISPNADGINSVDTIVERAKILLVDDNPINIKTFEEYLTVVGYKIVVAHDGIAALEQADKVSPDLILMDIQMPRMDGLTACQELRAQEKTKTIPIIALTALAMSGDREKCLAAGANAYLSKPVRLPELVKLIEQLLTPKT